VNVLSSVHATALELYEIPDFERHIADEVRAALVPEEVLVSAPRPSSTTNRHFSFFS
jgi:hypothetical protein